jgi:hypothetical protein
MRHRYFHRICEDVIKLGQLELKHKEEPWFGLVDMGRFAEIDGTPSTARAVMADRACFAISVAPGLMAHFNRHRKFSPYLYDLFGQPRLGANAYSMMKRMQLQYGMYCNMAAKNKERLRVRTLLRYCPENEVTHSGRVRQIFERALNSLCPPVNEYGPLLTWNYVYKTKMCTAVEITKLRVSHREWLSLPVHFVLRHVPNREERLDSDVLSSTHADEKFYAEKGANDEKSDKTTPKDRRTERTNSIFFDASARSCVVEDEQRNVSRSRREGSAANPISERRGAGRP